MVPRRLAVGNPPANFLCPTAEMARKCNATYRSTDKGRATEKRALAKRRAEAHKLEARLWPTGVKCPLCGVGDCVPARAPKPVTGTDNSGSPDRKRRKKGTQ